MRRSVCILSFSHIARDARVLRQIKYLSPAYDLTVIGYGPPHPLYADSQRIRWIQIGQGALHQEPNLLTALRNLDMQSIRIIPRAARKARQLSNKLLSWAGIVMSHAQEMRYWRQIQYQEAWKHILAVKCDAYHANDWDAIPIAAQAARRNNARLVIDLHEYAPLEYADTPGWWIKKRFINHILRKYACRADAAITVAAPIADRYRDEFGFFPTVIMNAPESIPLDVPVMDGKNIRLVHHGGASRLRRPELMIETIARCDKRYTLHFMFLQNEYVTELKGLGEKLAPGRIFFLDAVPPEDILPKISQFDVGFYILPPSNYNNLIALPNKFLDFISAGLAVCIGPSPSMAEVVNKYGLGVVGNSFDPADMAAQLNQVSLEHWMDMRKATRTAAGEINAQIEMEKLVNIYDNLLRN